MQTDNRGPSAGAAAGAGKSPTICRRLQRAFQARPAFRPLLRLTGRPQDGGAATTTGVPPAATRPPVLLPAHAPTPSPAGKAPKATAPVTLPVTPQKPAAAKGGDKPVGKVPASAPTTVSATANMVADKVAGWMPVPAPPSAVATGRPSADTKAEDKAQQNKGKVSVSSRVRKALASPK